MSNPGRAEMMGQGLRGNVRWGPRAWIKECRSMAWVKGVGQGLKNGGCTS